MDRTLKIKKKLTVFFISVMLAITTVLPVAYMNGAFAASKVPSKVTVSSVKANAYNKVTVSWKKASNVTSYNVYYKESGATKWTKIAKVGKSKTSYTHTSSTKYKLTPGKTYYYTVRGYNSSSKKSGSYNKTGLKVTIPGKPSKVTLISASASSDKSATVKWKKASNATEYRVYYRVNGTKKWNRIATVSSYKTSYTHTSSTKYPLAAGKTYYYTVRAYNKKAASLGSYNTTGLAVTMPATPAKVTLSSVKYTDSNKVNVTWKEAANSTEYRVYYKEKGASKWTKIATVKSGTTTYTHTSSTKYPLAAGKTYYYTVRGYNNVSKKSGSYDKTGKSVTMPGTPAKVTITDAYVTSSNHVIVEWKEATNSTEYRVYYRPSTVTKWTKIATVQEGVTEYTHVSSTKYPLEKGKTYYYTVRGYNSTSKTSGSYDKTGKSITMPSNQTDNVIKPDTDNNWFNMATATPEQVVKEVFRLTNIEREKAGIQPLIYDEGYQKAAMLRAQELSVLMSHTRPNGEDSDTANFDCDAASGSGENIAGGQNTPQKVIASWMNSPGHRAQLLCSENIYIGIGYYYDASSHYKYHWVQNFSEQKSNTRGTIRFFSDGGQFTIQNSTKYYQNITINGENLVYNFPGGKEILLSEVPIPQKEGYIFDCWVSQYGEDKLINAAATDPNNKYNRYYTARWIKNE